MIETLWGMKNAGVHIANGEGTVWDGLAFLPAGTYAFGRLGRATGLSCKLKNLRIVRKIRGLLTGRTAEELESIGCFVADTDVHLFEAASGLWLVGGAGLFAASALGTVAIGSAGRNRADRDDEDDLIDDAFTRPDMLDHLWIDARSARCVQRTLAAPGAAFGN